ncbi:DegT/DnrJ/EryC1/StrS aminotransferase family protein [Actinophytocola sp.]|uniref:DegT/DnrJ/EryC1/StrS family aminotransferase n=1 Tax=Actinophytocola sp. TaxID=1872138 RepID=UPI0025C1182F|nr:DegT/DnrJ/EryC1/StrS family aminotransferase [Actinophytocola sp.]
MSVPFHDPAARVADRAAEWEEALRRCVRELEWVRPSTSVARFEEELAAHCGVRHAIATSSGSSALLLLLAALGVGPGTEVVTVSQTFAVTVATIKLLGATPVLVDVERDAYTMDPLLALAAVGPRTRAVVPVHLYGRPMDVSRLGSPDVPVVEEACQSVGACLRGAPVGSLGTAAAMSFGREKAVAGLGEGGAVTTNDDELAVRLRRLNGHGWDGRAHLSVGTNLRMDALAAAVLRVELTHAESDLAARRAVADRYTAALSRLGVVRNPVVSPGDRHGLFVYAIEVPDRAAFCAELTRRGVGHRLHYEHPVHGWPAYQDLAGSLPVTEEIASRVLSLPLRPTLTSLEIDEVVEAVTAAHDLARA